MRSYLMGPLTRFGLAVAAIACLLDQATKLYLLFVSDLANGPVRLGPLFDLVLTRNTGISYGLFQTEGPPRSMGAARLQGGGRASVFAVAGSGARIDSPRCPSA